MADYDRRPRGGGGYNNRKRRYRGGWEQLLHTETVFTRNRP